MRGIRVNSKPTKTSYSIESISNTHRVRRTRRWSRNAQTIWSRTVDPAGRTDAVVGARLAVLRIVFRAG